MWNRCWSSASGFVKRSREADGENLRHGFASRGTEAGVSVSGSGEHWSASARHLFGQGVSGAADSGVSGIGDRGRGRERGGNGVVLLCTVSAGEGFLL